MEKSKGRTYAAPECARVGRAVRLTGAGRGCKADCKNKYRRSKSISEIDE